MFLIHCLSDQRDANGAPLVLSTFETESDIAKAYPEEYRDFQRAELEKKSKKGKTPSKGKSSKFSVVSSITQIKSKKFQFKAGNIQTVLLFVILLQFHFLYSHTLQVPRLRLPTVLLRVKPKHQEENKQHLQTVSCM